MRRIVTISWLALVVAAGPAPDGPPTPGPSKDDSPIPIFLNAPTDLDAFWKMLGRPDLVVLDGEEYRRLRQGADALRVNKVAPLVPIAAIAAIGEVSGDWARLTITVRATLAAEAPTWVPIHLDGLALSEIREGGRDLPARTTEGGAWEVELAGLGEHPVVVSAIAPVRATAEGKRLDLTVPVSASTRIELSVPSRVADASTGLNEPADILPTANGKGSRLVGRLSPRPRIELTWRERSGPSANLPTLLSAQGEIAMEVERGSIRTRSTWSVGAIRGSASQFALRLDAAEDVVDVEVDGRPSAFENRKDGAKMLLVIPLAEPLRTNATRSLTITTRRPIASEGAPRVPIQGYAFDQARVQTGVLAIVRNGPVFLNPTPGRGLRQIDPRTELPESLRTRPDTALAFEFNDQPFELALDVEPAPPRLLVENRTTITIDPRSARLDCRLICRASQGRAFELMVLVPDGLEFEDAGPLDVVASAQPVAQAAPGGEEQGRSRLLKISLIPQARGDEPFTVHLRGRSAIDASKPVSIPLFQPQGQPTIGGRFALVSDRNVSADLVEGGADSSPFRVESDGPPAEWSWPVRRPGPDLGLLWLRSDEDPETLPLRVAVRPRSIRHETTLAATIDRKGADIIEEISGEVAFGTLSRLDVAIPPEVPNRWDVEGGELAGRELLGQDPDGTRRYRLKFAREYPDGFRLRIRYRVPFAEPLDSSRDARLRLVPVRVLEGTSLGRVVRVAAEPEIVLASEAEGWTASAEPDPTAGTDQGPPTRLNYTRSEEKAAPISIFARLGRQLPMPSLVVSRLWIRTIQRLDDDLATTASFWVESRGGSMVLALPPGSRWIRARIGGREAVDGEVESVAADQYRIRFPSAATTGPILAAVDYEIPAAVAAKGWFPPHVLDGGVVQQTAWEVRIAGSRAGVGTPIGWVDENEWYWEGPIWRRRPWKSAAELGQWLNGGNQRFQVADPAVGGDLSGRHSYLFSKSGPPTPLRFAVFSRFALVLLCSGPILGFGLLILARRPPPRVLGAGLMVLAFCVATVADMNATLPVLQSAVPGICLLLGALLMHWFLERRDRRGASGRHPSIAGLPPLGSSVAASPGVGSDDSTAIRPRPMTSPAASTADHIILGPSHEPASKRSATSDLGHR